MSFQALILINDYIEISNGLFKAQTVLEQAALAFITQSIIINHQDSPNLIANKTWIN